MSKNIHRIQSPCRQFSIYPLGQPNTVSGEHIFLPESGQYNILWIKNGGGSISTVSSDYLIQGATVYFFRHGQIKEVVTSATTEGYLISLPAELFYIPGANFHLSCFAPQKALCPAYVSVRMDEEAMLDTGEILKRILKESSTAVPIQEEIVTQLLRVCLLYIFRTMPDPVPPKWARDLQLTREFMDLLRQNVAGKIKVAGYAARLNISPGYLNLVVKKVTGFPASYHIHQQIVDEAKRHFRDHGSSLKEIAYSLGFDDTAHFSKFFKANCGTNFTSFRKTFAR